MSSDDLMLTTTGTYASAGVPDPVPETLDDWSTADVIQAMDADSAL